MAEIKININLVSKAAEKAVDDLGNKTKKTEQRFDALKLSVKNTTSAFKVFAGNLAADAVSKFASFALDAGKAALKAASDFETAGVQLRVLTGSAASANALLKELQDFAANTPFQFTDITQASKALLAYGFSASEVTSKLQVLGDVSASSGQDLNEVTRIFGQVAAAGKLTGERLVQFEERAIPIGPAIAKTMGIAETSVRDMVSQGKVDFATFEKAFQSLNKEGGSAFGGMAERAKTVQGRFSNLTDAIEQLAVDFGQSLIPAAKAILIVLTDLIQQFKTDNVKSFAQVMGQTIPTAIEYATNAFIGINNVIQGFRIWLNVARAALAGFITAIIAVGEATLRVLRITGEFLNIDTSGLDNAIETLKTYRNAGIETAKSFIEDAKAVNESRKETNQLIDAAGQKVQQTYQLEAAAAAKAANAVVTAEDKKKEAKLQAAKLEAQLADQRKQAAEAEIENIEKVQVYKDQVAVANVEKAQLEDAQIEERRAAQLLKLQDQLATERETRLIAQSQIANDTIAHQQLIAKIEAEQANRRVAIAKAEAKAKKAESQKEIADRASFFQDLTTIASFGSKELFNITKGLQLANATVAGYTAIQMAASAAPFPANIPGIVAETARAAVTIAGINAQRPRFAQGGIVPGSSFSGDRVAAQVNSGEMILNRQQQAKLFEIANNGRAGGSQEIVVHTTVELDGAAVGKSVSRQVADGLKLGEVV